MIKLGIIGNGFVGLASTQLDCEEVQVIAFDTRPEACIPLGATMDDIVTCDIVFVSVPTPMMSNGECFTKIARQVITDLRARAYAGLIVLRSTVPVGTCDELGVFFMPEFLTEKNFMKDFVTNPDWIFGIYESCTETDALHFREAIRNLFDTCHRHQKIDSNTVHFMTAREAEMVKMFRNCFLATKASFCNEMYRFCETKQIDYNHVRELVGVDPRISHSHTFVPGPDGRFGFGGTCFPKDLNSLTFEMKKADVPCPILSAVKYRNETLDRPEKDWELDHGRAFVSSSSNITEKSQ